MVQMSIWVVTCFQHRFIEERHKDYFLMYTHHLVTIALVACSYFNSYLRIGVLVLCAMERGARILLRPAPFFSWTSAHRRENFFFHRYMHDVSDIPVDLLKIFNYCQLEGPRGLFLLEGVFITNLCTWAYYRCAARTRCFVFSAVHTHPSHLSSSPLAGSTSSPRRPSTGARSSVVARCPHSLATSVWQSGTRHTAAAVKRAICAATRRAGSRATAPSTSGRVSRWCEPRESDAAPPSAEKRRTLC